LDAAFSIASSSASRRSLPPCRGMPSSLPLLTLLPSSPPPPPPTLRSAGGAHPRASAISRRPALDAAFSIASASASPRSLLPCREMPSSLPLLILLPSSPLPPPTLRSAGGTHPRASVVSWKPALDAALSTASLSASRWLLPPGREMPCSLRQGMFWSLPRPRCNSPPKRSCGRVLRRWP